jgi:hypothetical protein
MRKPEEADPCPNCGSKGIGPEIPKEDQHMFGTTHFSTRIGIEDPYVYDGISWWQCGECSHIWKRFPWSPEYKGNKVKVKDVFALAYRVR